MGLSRAGKPPPILDEAFWEPGENQHGIRQRWRQFGTLAPSAVVCWVVVGVWDSRSLVLSRGHEASSTEVAPRQPQDFRQFNTNSEKSRRRRRSSGSRRRASN